MATLIERFKRFFENDPPKDPKKTPNSDPTKDSPEVADDSQDQEKPTETAPVKDKNSEIDPALINEEISSQQSSFYKTGAYQVRDWNPDDLVGKKGLEIYRTMRRDEQIRSCLNIKKLATLSTNWIVKPGNQESDLSKEMAKFCEYVLRNLKSSLGSDVKKDDDLSSQSVNTVTFNAGSFQTNLYNILSALDYGFSLSEKIWKYYEDGPWAGKLGLVGLKTREPFGYDFCSDKHGNLIGIVPPGGWNQKLKNVKPGYAMYPPSKFVIYSYDYEFSNWYGQSDLRTAHRAWFCKDITIKFMNIYLERYGSPTAVLKYPRGKGKVSREMIRRLDDILKNMQSRSGFRIPDDITAELLEATRSGESGYIKAIEKHDMSISRAILIPNKLGFGDDQGGSYALGKKHFDVFIFVIQKLRADIQETIVNEQILKPMLQFNYGEVPEELMPKFEFESLIGEDINEKAGVVKILVDAGIVDKREEWVRDYVEVPKRDLDLYPHKTPLGEADVPDPQPGFGPDGRPMPMPGGGRGPMNVDPKKKVASKKFVKRALKPVEKKVNFKKFVAGTETLQADFIDQAQDLMMVTKKNLSKQLEKALTDKDTGAELSAKGMIDVGKLLRNYLIKMHLDSKLNALEELDGPDLIVEVKRRFWKAFSSGAIEDWEPVDPTEAIDFFNRKALAYVTKDGSKKLLTLAKSKELKFYADRAFYISGVEEDYILKQAKNILLTSISKGWSNSEAQTELGQLFDKYLSKGVLSDGELTSPHRLETIVRTNLMEAYNRGRMTMFKDPEVSDDVPYVMWSSIIDEVTTDYCTVMDSKYFRVDDIEPPPAHYNCRSVLVPVTSYEVDQDPEAIDVTTQAEAESEAGPRMAGFKKKENAE